MPASKSDTATSPAWMRMARALYHPLFGGSSHEQVRKKLDRWVEQDEGD